MATSRSEGLRSDFPAFANLNLMESETTMKLSFGAYQAIT